MKKFLFSTLIAISIVSSAFAREEKKIAFAKDEKNIPYKILNDFTAEFNEATDVNWTVKPDFTEACFNLDGKQLSAFYNLSGEKIGTTQDVNFETLPSRAKSCIGKKYSDYSIKEMILFESDYETAYFVAAENNSRSVIFKVLNGYVSIFKKTKVIKSNLSNKPLQLAVLY